MLVVAVKRAWAWAQRPRPKDWFALNKDNLNEA